MAFASTKNLLWINWTGVQIKLFCHLYDEMWMCGVWLDGEWNVCECCEQLERMKYFDFDEWRRRYMQWMNDNKSRVMDFFRKQDRDHDGKITRQEFIDGILQSSQ